MKKNMGTADKFIRVLIGILIAILYYMNIISGITAIIILAVGILLLITSLIGFCPLYTVFGIRTTKKAQDLI